MWDIATGGVKARLEGHSDAVRSVVFSPDGKTIASCSNDGTVRVWDVATGDEMEMLEVNRITDRVKERWEYRRDRVSSIAFSPDGKTIASGSYDKTVRVWDVTTGEVMAKIQGHSERVYSIAFSPDGKTIASGAWDGTVRVWDVATGDEMAKFDYNVENDRDNDDHSVFSVAFSPDSKTIASGLVDSTVRVWDVATGVEMAKLEGHRHDIDSVAFSPDGKTIASSSFDKTVRLWDVATE